LLTLFALRVYNMVMLEPNQIVELLNVLRAKKGWSRTKVAAELGVTEGAVRKWESGGSHPRWDTAKKLYEWWSEHQLDQKVPA
jgi:transcriptional regulator with XRE-family HTH domain